MRGAEKTLYWVYCFSFAFDFKGEEGGSAIQYLFFAVLLISGATYLAASVPKRISRVAPPRGLAWVNSLWWFYIASTAFTAFAMNVQFDHYLRILVPFFVCGLSLTIAKRLLSRGIRLSDIVKPLIYASIASTLWTAHYAIAISGISLEEMRYQVISPAAPLVLAYGFWMALVGKRPTPIEILLILLSVVILVLSITRSFFIVVCGLIAMFFLLRQHSKSRKLERTVKVVMVSVVVGCAGLLLALYVRSDAMDRWQFRIFEARNSDNVDITTLTRIAEFSGQWNSLREDAESLAVGRGLGSTYTRDTWYSNQLGNAVTRDSYTAWYGGHSFWVYSLYSGGFLFGLIVPAIYLTSLFSAWRRARTSMQAEAFWVSNPSVKFQVMPIMVLVSYLGDTFSSHPIIMSRLSALIIGIFIGLSWRSSARAAIIRDPASCNGRERALSRRTI